MQFVLKFFTGEIDSEDLMSLDIDQLNEILKAAAYFGNINLILLGQRAIIVKASELDVPILISSQNTHLDYIVKLAKIYGQPIKLENLNKTNRF